MTVKLFFLALASVSLSALAQIMLKAGVSDPKLAGAFASAGRVAVILGVLASPYVIAGLSLYFLGALVWLVVLSQVEVSIAYPLVGLGFLLTAIFAAVFLNESVSPMRLLGTGLVALGVYFVARS